jgi:hypothetical protein
MLLSRHILRKKKKNRKFISVKIIVETGKIIVETGLRPVSTYFI